MMAFIQISILLYFFAVNGLYLLLFFFSCAVIVHYRWIFRFRGASEILKARVTPPISVLAPAYNEGKGIVSSVHSLLKLNYPQYEVIVINDGSKDNTIAVLEEAFSLRKTAHVYHRVIPTASMKAIYRSKTYPNLWVLDKENGGKADALNAGINFSQFPLFCAIDADSILERDALVRVIRPYMDRFQEVVAVGGIVRVANGCRIVDGIVEEVGLAKKWLPNFQVVEYLRAFLSGRVAWSAWNALLVISGAFGVFKKQPVMDVGGYSTDTVGEDMELVVKLHRHLRRQKKKYSIHFIPDPVCWTEVPEKLGMLGRQRNRWQRGLAQALYRHISLFGNPRYGLLGLLAMPYFVLVELLSPLVELTGYALFGFAIFAGAVYWESVATFFILAVWMGIFLSLLSVLLEEFVLHRYPRVRNLLKLLVSSVLENLGYRQMTSFFRLKGLVDFLRRQNAWGYIERKGLEVVR
ncbi:MAG: glycosyltransferase [Elusimicrobia bacterium]|nr:glycosyltransferase [Elusimicrobiota bacterium]